MCTGLLKTIDLKIIWAEYPLAKPEGNDECWGKNTKGNRECPYGPERQSGQRTFMYRLLISRRWWT